MGNEDRQLVCKYCMSLQFLCLFFSPSIFHDPSEREGNAGQERSVLCCKANEKGELPNLCPNFFLFVFCFTLDHSHLIQAFYRFYG